MIVMRGARLEEMARFGLVDVLSNAAYFGVLWLLRGLSTPWWLAAAVAYVLSMILNYHLQRNFTFRSPLTHEETGGRYVVVQLGGMMLNSAILELLLGRRLLDACVARVVSGYAPNVSSWPSVRVVLAQGISLAVTTLSSYAAQRSWVFGRAVKE